MGSFRGRRGRGGALGGGVLLLTCLVPSYARAAPATQDDPSDAHVVFTIDVPRIRESSSLVVSTAHEGLVYTANDSGDGPVIYVLDDAGHLVGRTTLDGVTAVDIEAMSGGADGSLVVGDIGDNDADRDSVQIYRIPQPQPGDHVVTPESVTLTYSDGPRNAESILYDARSERVFVVSKEILAHVYRSPPHVFSLSNAVLQPVVSAPLIATDATFLPGDGAVVVRTYHHAFVYGYPSWKLRTDFVLPHQKQGESIASVPGKKVVWVGSEGVNSPVWVVPLPAVAAKLLHHVGSASSAPPAAGAPSGGAAVAAAEGSHGIAKSVVRISGSAVALVVVVGTVVFLFRGRRRSSAR